MTALALQTPRPAPAGGVPYLGHGIGLRRPHYDAIVETVEAEATRHEIDFFEILVENYMSFGGRPRAVLERLLRSRPFVLHGVGLSIGGPDPLSEDYLTHLERLIDATGAPWFSDHLCSSGGFGVEYHDLLPLPFTEAALDHVSRRVERIQRRFPIPFALENPSYYIELGASEMSELEFIQRLVARTGVKLLLDVNNVYVNSQNHGYEPRAFIEGIPPEAVVQIHMAGHERLPEVIIDTHGAPAVPEVLALYAHTLEHTGPVSTLVEWDNDIPELPVLLEENRKVRAVARETLGEVEVAAWTR
ncbi:MAG: DUF692 domain-containing protein [Deltaproteobacteria bacterium]|nr:DUF692 domain-containing protein [Deltaproteobacteria bacterium]